jgi:hypothetical protein
MFRILMRNIVTNEIYEGCIYDNEDDVYEAVKEAQRITNKNHFPFVYWWELVR